MPSLRFRRLTELFVTGKPVPLPDGTYLWVQALNAFEREECISDAQIARSRLTLALRDNSDERMKIQARLAEIGKDKMAEDLANYKVEGKTPDFAEDMRADPEWKERMEIIMRTDFDEAAKPPTQEETLLMAKINAEVLAEFAKREQDEIGFLMRRYDSMSDEDFIEEWIDAWIERRGGELAQAEYRLTEIWYAARFCEATTPTEARDDNGQPVADFDLGTLDHSRCDGHQEKVFASKAEARTAPEALQEFLRTALDELNLAGRDPKDSDSPESSSDSSQPPSEEAASTASSSTETPAPPPGT